MLHKCHMTMHCPRMQSILKNAVTRWISYTDIVNSESNSHLTSSDTRESNIHMCEITTFHGVVRDTCMHR